MTSLPYQHPTLSLHLSDRNLHPILTSAHSNTQLEALTSLATTSLTAHSAAHRLALGHPQRLIVEHGPGHPVLLTTYLDPAAAASPKHHPAPSTAAHSSPAVAVPVDELAAMSLADAASDAQEPPKHHESPSKSKSRPHTRDSVAPSAKSKDKPRKNPTAPMLVGIVVANTAEEALEARRAAVRLERVAREVQREWVAEERERGYDTDESG